MKKLTVPKISVFLILSIFSALVFLSCSGANYSGLQTSNEVNRLFESFQVLDDHNYYYSGSDNRPEAILGVHKDYVLKTKLWKPVNLTSEQLRLWINMMTDHRGTSFRIFGARVVVAGGKQIGIWYSPYYWTSVRMLDDRHVVINTPTASPGEIKRGFLFGHDED